MSRFSLVVGLAACLFAGQGSAERELVVRFELVTKEGAPAPTAAIFSFRRTGEDLESAVRVAVRPDTREVSLAESSWEVELTAEGYWSPPQVWNVSSSYSGSAIEVPVWPTGFVEGRLTPEATRAPFPADFRLRFEAVEPLREPALTRSEVACPVNPETGAFRCAIPASHLFVSLRRPGYVPVYRPGLRLARGSAVDLGRITFLPGASLVAWVALDGARIEADKGHAVLRTTASSPGDRAGQRRLEAREVVVPVLPDGFVQFTGLPAGVYDLVVSYPDFAPQTVRRIAVSSRREVALPTPVTLHRPVDLEVHVEPSVDFGGRPWRITVERRGGLDETPLTGPTDETGVWKVEEFLPGHCRFTVTSSEGDRFASVDHEVTDATSAVVPIEIRSIAVHGRVTLGDEPIAAEVIFGTQNGDVTSTLFADAEGRFQGLLPQAGTWPVEIRSQSPAVEVTKVVEVDMDPDEMGVASVDIKLARNRVFGRILDDQGKPLAKARVTLVPFSSNLVSSVGSDDEGRFEFLIVAPGTAMLSGQMRALGEAWSGPGQIVEVRDDDEIGPIELRLEKGRTIWVTVTNPEGPVTGATVRFTPLDPRFSRGSEALSGPDGKAEIRVPASVARGAASVEPPGYFFDVVDVRLAQKESLLLPVATAGGTVVFEFPEGEPARETVILRRGLPVPLANLRRWAALPPGAPAPLLRVPRLAAGPWSLCSIPRASLPGLMSNPTGLTELEAQARCVTGELVPGGDLTLRFASDSGETPETPSRLHESPAPRQNAQP